MTCLKSWRARFFNLISSFTWFALRVRRSERTWREWRWTLWGKVMISSRWWTRSSQSLARASRFAWLSLSTVFFLNKRNVTAHLKTSDTSWTWRTRWIMRRRSMRGRRCATDIRPWTRSCALSSNARTRPFYHSRPLLRHRSAPSTAGLNKRNYSEPSKRSCCAPRSRRSLMVASSISKPLRLNRSRWPRNSARWSAWRSTHVSLQTKRLRCWYRTW